MRRRDESWPYSPVGDQPSWPAGDQEVGWPSPAAGDYPQNAGWPFPEGEGQPGWPADEAGPGWPPDGDFPSWPAGGGDAGGQFGEDHPSWPAGDDIRGTPHAAGGSAPPRRRPDRPQQDRRALASRSAPAGQARVPGSGAPEWAPRRSGSWVSAAPQAHLAASDAFAGAPDGGGGQALLTEDPPTGQRPAGGDPVRLAERILWEADQEAAAITEQALEQADAIRQAAEREAGQIRQQAAQRGELARDVEREAEQIRQQAAQEAEQVRETAAREADELRAGAIRLSAELGRVAEYVTRSLTIPAIPVAEPRALPRQQDTDGYAAAPMPGVEPQTRSWQQDTSGYAAAPMPGVEPQVRPRRQDTNGYAAAPVPGTRTVNPGTAPRTRTATPGTAPRTRPGGPARQTATPTNKGQAQGRQRRAMRVATAGTVALVSIAAIGAATYTGIHGFRFFVFRESGQGETPGNFLDTNFLARQAAAQHHDSAPKGRHHKATASQ